MSEMTGFDSSARERAWKSADEAQFTAGLAAPNPHSTDMQLPPGLEEDGAS
jgi:hypothetical protein